MVPNQTWDASSDSQDASKPKSVVIRCKHGPTRTYGEDQVKKSRRTATSLHMRYRI